MPDEPKSPSPTPDHKPTPAAGSAAASTSEKSAGPAKSAGPTAVAWESPLVTRLTARYGSGVDALTYLGQNYILVDSRVVAELLRVLCDEETFDYCVDVTALHYPEREKQFDVIWILYSFAGNERIRVKTMIADGESVGSVVSIWPAANWLEREVFDMFGIRFEGHPDLKRILLPDGWKGHPLRKDYGIIQQDQEWVQINLGIESGQ
jgi:NADH-quinone oxidoreductase subunit C